MKGWLERFKGKGYKARLLAPIDEFFDRRLGVRTYGFKEFNSNSDAPDWQCHYMPSSYRALFALFKASNVGPGSHVVDFGAGMGRVLFAAAYLGAEQCIGVELDEELLTHARRNRERSRYGHVIELVHGDAARFEIPSTANRFFFFNPFGAGTMAQVLANVEASLRAHPRPVEIIYYNPSRCAVLESSGLFSLREAWPELPGKRHAAQFWVNQSGVKGALQA
jgi:16S rRNA G966 N2-methylase RsmD